MITFQNDGLIDLRAVTTFGVSAKENDSPIGYFGTGLKYAIAIVLRLGGKIELWRGTQRYRFEKQPASMRGTEFQLVVMHEMALGPVPVTTVELGFTTDLGKNWEAWQAFRELYCNALDEGGRAFPTREEPREDATTIHVTLEAFDECYRQRGTIVLDSAPLATLQGLEIHRGPSEGVYYRGILTGKTDRPCEYKYNITSSQMLTEDRTLRSPNWALTCAVSNALLHLEDRALLREWLHAPPDSWEHRADIYGGTADRPGAVFLEVATQATMDVARPLNITVRSLLQQYGALPELVELVTLDEVESKQLQRAKDVCAMLGYQIDKHPIEVVESLGRGVLGTVRGNTILLSKLAFNVGTKCVAGTLLEEFLHLEYSFQDMTRDFQNYLVDRIMTTLEKLVLKEAI